MFWRSPCKRRGGDCPFLEMGLVEYTGQNCLLGSAEGCIKIPIQGRLGLLKPGNDSTHEYTLKIQESTGGTPCVEFKLRSKPPSAFASGGDKKDGSLDVGQGYEDVIFDVRKSSKMQLSGYQTDVAVFCKLEHHKGDFECLSGHKVTIILKVV